MSITRGIEIWKKDQIEGEVYNSRWVGWKDRDLDHWIFLYLNRCVVGSLLRWIRSDDLFVEEVPKEIFADMADRLLSRRYDLELGEDEQDDMERLEEYRPRYIKGFAAALKQLMLEVGADEMMGVLVHGRLTLGMKRFQFAYSVEKSCRISE